MLLADFRREDIGIGNALAIGDVHANQHILVIGFLGPQEFASGGIQGPDDAGFAGNAGQHLAAGAGTDGGVDPGDVFRPRCDFGFHHQPGKGMVLVPVVTGDMLEVPLDGAGVGIQGQGGIGV